ncbi:molybdate ABC transporter substrate-binding protein [Pseudanabaena sp. PCC 6802]|uniref:molybdate ABC transporter substrate-binding protein n=1 Tax=Pseudanabaena sp. PCC 6802 TaxID=118173 RepID=UPI000349AB85|nr:molybdate ABC transporter substrate-binding protein [Pseudanabaena sp. PCC 6802]
MNRRRVFTFIACIALTFSLVVGTKFFERHPAIAQGNTSLLVSAAASLQDALKEIAPIYQKSQPAVAVKYNFGASGALQQQIEQGAPVDVFISAATKQMSALQSKGLILQDTNQNLLGNRLALIVPRNSTLGITSVRNLAGGNVKKIAVGEPRSVPVGQYSEEVFKKLGIAEQVKSKLILGNTVRNVLAAVESGNADAGIVYITDAKISDRVRVVELISTNLHSPIVYPIAVLKNSKNIPVAKNYVKFLSSGTARSVFEKYGFTLAKS